MLKLVVLALLACLVHGCSFPPDVRPPRPYTKAEVLYTSDIVVHVVAGAKAEEHQPPAMVMAKCVFKDKQSQVPPDNQIALDLDYYTSCSGVWPTTEGEEYVMALRQTSSGKFIPDEAEMNALEQATFPADDATMETLLGLCGLQDPPTGAQCPEGIEVNQPDCVNAPYNAPSTTVTTPQETGDSNEVTGTMITTDFTSLAVRIQGHVFLALMLVVVVVAMVQFS